MDSGFIYGRINYESSIHNCCKIGITQNIPCREISYITTEINRGKWFFIINVYKIEYAKNIEKKIKNDLTELNFYQGAGTEFFKNTNLLNKIIEIIKEMNINFHILNDDEIKKLNKTFYERTMDEIIKDIKKYKNISVDEKIINKEKLQYIEQYFKMNSNFKLYQYQDNILNKSIDILKSKKKGLLLWACGLGKTLFSLKIAEKLKCKNILIGVPNRNLSQQFFKEIKKITSHDPILFQSKTDLKEIKEKLQENNVNIIITTYHSCYKLPNIKTNKKFDIKIGDEAHHLSNRFNVNEKNFLKFHDIETKYSLFMTATSKSCDDISMDDEKYFGKIIDKKSIKWSILNKKICNYKIISIQNNINSLDEIYQHIKLKINHIDDNIDLKKLFLSSFATLKAIEDKISKKILIYTNSIKTAQIIYKIINYLLVSNIFIFKDIYNNSISSKSENIDICEEIEKFKKAKYGIISCVQIFGEGFNLPILDSVVVAENMESNIRIVQYLLRPTRLYFDKEFAKIIIPTNSNMIDNNLKNIIKKMKFEDDIIDQKIESYSIISKKYEKVDSKNKIGKIRMKYNEKNLRKIQLEIHEGSFTSVKYKEKIYNYLKSIVKEYNFKTINSYKKSEHYKYHLEFTNNIDFSLYFGNYDFWKGWYNFLNIDTSSFIKNSIEFLNYCKKNKIKTIEEYRILAICDNKLPEEPDIFYNNSGILNKLIIKNKRKKL